MAHGSDKVASSDELDVSIEHSGGLERRMTVRVPSAVIERQVEARLRKVGKTARMKGFRPGKIPAKVIRQQYGGQVRQEVVSDVIRHSYSRAITERSLQPAGGPSIEPLSGQDDGHFSFRAVFEVYPDIELKGVEGLNLEMPVVEIGAADVDEMIEKLRLQRAEWHAVERKAEAGDRAVVDFVGTVDGVPFEGGEGNEVPIVIGDGQVIEDFEKALKGLAAGDRKSAKVKFPKDYPAAELAGKKAVFEITCMRVEERRLPDVDEAFIEAFGVAEGGVEALKEEVRANMQRELDERLRVERKGRVLDAFLAANAVALPRTLVEQEISNLQAEAMRRMGIDDAAKAPARDRFEATAQRRVSLGLLVQELVRSRGIELDRARVDARIKELSAPYESPDQVERLYRSDRNLLGQIESGVIEEQAVDLLYGNAEVKEEKTSFSDFMSA